MTVFGSIGFALTDHPTRASVHAWTPTADIAVVPFVEPSKEGRTTSAIVGASVVAQF